MRGSGHTGVSGVGSKSSGGMKCDSASAGKNLMSSSSGRSVRSFFAASCTSRRNRDAGVPRGTTTSRFLRSTSRAVWPGMGGGSETTNGAVKSSEPEPN